MIVDFPDLDPVAISLGAVQIRWYALAYLGGFLLGWWYAVQLVRRYFSKDKAGGVVTKDHIDDFVSWAIIGVILGGRVGYALFYQWDYYSHNWVDILKIWQGGMSFHGGALGVIIAMFLFAWIKKIPVLRLADIVACVVPIGIFFGRVANFINGELYGRVTDGTWGVVFPAGGSAPRHPSQFYEAGLEGLALFVILLVAARSAVVRQRAGVLSAMFLLGYGSFRFFVEHFREPDEHLGFVLGSLSMGQVLSFGMLALGIAVLVVAFKKHNNA